MGVELCNLGHNKGNALERTLTLSTWSVTLLNEKIAYFRINCWCNPHKVKIKVIGLSLHLVH